MQLIYQIHRISEILRHPVQVLFLEENVDGIDLKLRLLDHQQVIASLQDAGLKHRIGLRLANKHHVLVEFLYYRTCHNQSFQLRNLPSLPHLLP